MININKNWFFGVIKFCFIICEKISEINKIFNIGFRSMAKTEMHTVSDGNDKDFFENYTHRIKVN